MATQTHSKEFFELIKNIGEAKSKQEEDKTILRELGLLHTHLNNPKTTLKLMKEYIVRLLYCEMLGHNASFGYFSAIKLTSSTNLLEKRVGYLAVSLCIPKDHELHLLIIANMQKDLKSTNYLVVSCALTAATKLISEETIPALLNLVIEHKKHENAHVRKKVIVLLHTFHLVSPGSVPDILEHAKDALCDRDPCVMAASLGLFYDLAHDEQYIPELKGLTSGLVTVLQQVKDHRLPRDFDYHRIPAPWIQIKLLKILAILAKDDRTVSEQLYETLREVMTRADIGTNIGHAVVYECVATITSAYPNNLLLENAASAISRFVTSSNHNLKYLGIKALTELVKINQKYATQHQMVVIDCLEDPDETLKRRTLSLLYTMTNASNATVIVKKLLDFAKKSMDDHMREELVQNITSLAEQFTPNIFWYIDTMNALFEIGPEYVPQSAIQNMMTVISLGVGDDEEKDEEMRKYCVDTFFEILDTKSVVHDLHLQVISWVLGEYGYMSEQYSQNDILELLCDVVDRQFELDDTRGCVISALMKLVAQTGGIIPSTVEGILHKHKNSKNVDLQQRCYEFLALCQSCNDSNREQVMETVLPVDGSCEEIDVDDTLSFLDSFVQRARQTGASPYLEHHQRVTLEEQVEKKLIIKEYEKPKVTTTHMYESFAPKETIPEDKAMDISHKEQSFYPSTMPSNGSGLNPSLLQNKARIWADEDEEEEPTLTMPSTPSYSSDLPRSRARSDTGSSASSTGLSPSNPFPLSKQDRVEPVAPKNKRQERLRQELFNPSGDTTGYVPKKKQPIKRRNSRAGQQINFQPPVEQQEPDMFAEMTVNETPAVVESKPAPATQQQPAAKQQSMIDFDDFFSGPTTSIGSSTLPENDIFTAITPTIPNQATPSPKSDDFFGLGDISSQSSSSLDDVLKPTPVVHTAPAKQATPSQSAAPRNSYLITRLQSEAQRASETISLAKDDLLEITCDKFLRQDSLILALQFRTDRGYTLTNLSCQLQPPSKFSLKFEYDTAFNAPIIRGNNVTFSKLEPGTPIALLCELQLTDYTGFGTSFMGTISYADQNKRSKFLNVTTLVDLIDLLRPLDLTVPEFGKQWVSYPHEKKIQLKSSTYTPQSYAEKVEKHLNVKIIQIIKSEAVGLARIINHEQNVLVLVHAKIQQGALSFSVKSKDKTLCDHICRIAMKVLG